VTIRIAGQRCDVSNELPASGMFHRGGNAHLENSYGRCALPLPMPRPLARAGNRPCDRTGGALDPGRAELTGAGLALVLDQSQLADPPRGLAQPHPELLDQARLKSYRWFIVGRVCVGAFMGQVDSSITQTLLPHLELEFHASLSAVS
jgi:hypothetical protein